MTLGLLGVESRFDAAPFMTGEKIDSQIHARLVFINKLQNKTLALRCHRNEILPLISRLPNEVLTEIFLLFVSASYDSSCDNTGPPVYDVFKWLQITHVCHRWRAVALVQPRLWERIPITDRVDCMQAFVERSRDRPLLIAPGSRDLDTEPDPRIFDWLAPAVNRIKSMSLYLTRRLLRSLDHIMEHPETSVPLLDTLELCAILDEDEASLPRQFWFISTADLPRLRHLTTVDFPLSFTHSLIRPTLTRLRAIGPCLKHQT